MKTGIDFLQLIKYNKDMTICIASIADDGKSLILSSDKEVTYAFPLATEIETDQKKIAKITNKIYVLTAGIGNFCAEIVNNVKRDKSGATSVKEVADSTLARYIELRTRQMEERYLRPIGFTNIADFIQRQQQLNPQIAAQLHTFLAQDPQNIFDVELIIAGLDNTGVHVYLLAKPGTLIQMDTQGFSAIGIGGIHAFNSLLANNYSAKLSLKEALYFTYQAKKRSEVAPGVGALTDITILTENDKIYELTDDEISKLNKVHEDIKSSISTAVKEKIDEYKFPKENGEAKKVTT